MSRGKRYNEEPKLNYKKVIAVILALIVLVLFVLSIQHILSVSKDSGKISSTSYFTVYANNKWGVINETGTEVIAPSYEEMIIIPNNKKDVFLITYDINETDETYKTKVLNSKNQEIFTGYDKIECLENHNESNSLWYESNILKVEKNGKFGLIDLTGKEIIPVEYDNISVISGIENSILIQKDEVYGLVNTEGKQIIKCEYKEIKALGKDYKEGYITVNSEGKYGIVNYTGTQVLANNYEEIKQIYGSNLFVIKENGKEKVVGTDGTVVLEDGFDSVYSILQNSTTGIIFVKSNKYGVMNSNSEILIQATFENLKEAKTSTYIAVNNGKYGIVDAAGETKVEFKYSNITYNKEADIFIAEDENYNSEIIDSNFEVKLTGVLSEINTTSGYLKININGENKYYNFKFEEKSNKDVFVSNTLFLDKKDGKYGFIDKTGTVVVDYIYDDATEQNQYGYAAVKKDGVWGSIDNKGNIAISPKYNLDNNYTISFIGKWHLGQDINMNYYCEK